MGKKLIIILVFVIIICLVGVYFFFFKSPSNLQSSNFGVSNSQGSSLNSGSENLEKARVYARGCFFDGTNYNEACSQALEYFQKTIDSTTNPEIKAAAMLEASAKLLWMKRFDEAESMANNLLSLDKGDKETCQMRNLMGNIARLKKEYEYAAEHFTEALEPCKNAKRHLPEAYDGARRNLCNIYYQYLDQCTKVKEICPDLYYNLTC
jgi:tetratricopeptide (TPR) repeat protein